MSLKISNFTKLREKLNGKIKAQLSAKKDDLKKVKFSVPNFKNLKNIDLKGLRLKLNGAAERSLRRAAHHLEKLPPIRDLLLKAQSRPFRYALIVFAGFLAGDLVDQSLVTFLFSTPSKTPPPRIVQEPPFLQNRSQYETIITRNAFCPGCPVPDMKMRSIERPKDCGRAGPLGASGVKIIGTIVLSNPKYSVATLSISGGETIAIKTGDTFQDLGSVFEIRRNRICFLNEDGILHALDMPEEASVPFGQPVAAALPPSNYEGISRKSENDFEIKRSFLLEKLNDPNLLFQAKAVPYKENGETKGFKILSIVPGSVYESLGIQVNDVITGVNGEPMNSISRAQELFAAANSAKEVSLDIIRGGSPSTFKYQVR